MKVIVLPPYARCVVIGNENHLNHISQRDEIAKCEHNSDGHFLDGILNTMMFSEVTIVLNENKTS